MVILIQLLANMRINTRKITTVALLSALAIILGIIDSYIPSLIPGWKIGLANIVILLCLINYGIIESLFISLIRVFIVSIFASSLFSMSFFMSLAGAISSLLIMWILVKFIKRLHLVTISIIGSLIHSLTQVLVGIIYIGNNVLLYYLPLLFLISIGSGLLIGLSVFYLNKLNLIK